MQQTNNSIFFLEVPHRVACIQRNARDLSHQRHISHPKGQNLLSGGIVLQEINGGGRAAAVRHVDKRGGSAFRTRMKPFLRERGEGGIRRCDSNDRTKTLGPMGSTRTMPPMPTERTKSEKAKSCPSATPPPTSTSTPGRVSLSVASTVPPATLARQRRRLGLAAKRLRGGP